MGDGNHAAVIATLPDEGRTACSDRLGCHSACADGSNRYLGRWCSLFRAALRIVRARTLHGRVGMRLAGSDKCWTESCAFSERASSDLHPSLKTDCFAHPPHTYFLTHKPQVPTL
jgi:hypothetical protein